MTTRENFITTDFKAEPHIAGASQIRSAETAGDTKKQEFRFQKIN